jgi:hypothetical protein
MSRRSSFVLFEYILGLHKQKILYTNGTNLLLFFLALTPHIPPEER